MKPRSCCTTSEIRAFRAALRQPVRNIRRHHRAGPTCSRGGFLPCHILLELEGRDGVSLRALQEAMAPDKAALSRAVDGLVGEKLVTREQNPDNRRAVVIAHTKAGRAKVAEINDYSDEKYARLFGMIPEKEQATVVCAVDYLAKAFEEFETCAGTCVPKKKGGSS